MMDLGRLLWFQRLAVDKRSIYAIQVDDIQSIRFEPNLGVDPGNTLIIRINAPQINIWDDRLAFYIPA